MGQLDREPTHLVHVTNGYARASDTADYVADMSDQLCRMAAAGGHDVLATLLKLASAEARRVADR